ncbi:MAG: hypothetical protein RL318_1911, partial [Fibrobacterota bacterium]
MHRTCHHTGIALINSLKRSATFPAMPRPNPRRSLVLSRAVGIACGLFLSACTSPPATLDLRAGSKPWNPGEWTPGTASSCPVIHPSVQPWIQPEILRSRVIDKYSETAASPVFQPRFS